MENETESMCSAQMRGPQCTNSRAPPAQALKAVVQQWCSSASTLPMSLQVVARSGLFSCSQS